MYRPINDCIGRLMTLSADNPIGTDIPIFRKFDRYRIGRLSADYRPNIGCRYLTDMVSVRTLEKGAWLQNMTLATDRVSVLLANFEVKQ